MNKSKLMVERRLYKGSSALVVFPQMVKIALDEFQMYIEEITSYLENKRLQIDKEFNEALKNKSEDDEFEPFDYFEDDIIKYNNTFPPYTYNPLLLHLYGLFEHWLKRLCELDHRKGLSPIKVTHLSGHNYLEKSRNYLELVAEIDVSNTTSEWKKILEIQKVRNCIAHNDANIRVEKQRPVEKQELYQFMIKCPQIKFNKDSGDFYINDPQFLIEIIKIIEKYITEICISLRSRRVVAKNMSMEFNNDKWGQEKVRELIVDIIKGLDMLEQNENRKDEFKDTDLRFNLSEHFSSMAFNLTKLYSFFCDGEWKTEDKELIVKKRLKGLEFLNQIYGVK